MITIWKFPLELTGEQTVRMPAGARPISVGLDPSGVLCIWARVTAQNPTERRAVFIIGTGHHAEHVRHDEFLGTVRMDQFVWHVYVESKPQPA